ncbi:hypothetical protein ACSBR2_021918 [Camellia fascicularis]
MPARSKIRRSSRGDRTAPSSRPNHRTHHLQRIFHVGSGAIESGAYKAAIAVAKAVIDAASQLGLPEMHVLNISGGFTAGPQFDESATAVKSTIQEYFNESDLTVIAELGRFFCRVSFHVSHQHYREACEGGAEGELYKRRRLQVHELRIDHRGGRGSVVATKPPIRHPSATLADWRKSIRIRPPIRRMCIERIGGLADGDESVWRFEIL